MVINFEENNAICHESVSEMDTCMILGLKSCCLLYLVELVSSIC